MLAYICPYTQCATCGSDGSGEIENKSCRWFPIRYVPKFQILVITRSTRHTSMLNMSEYIHISLYFSQYDVTDLSREICRLEDENRQLTKQLESIVNTYQCCRQLFAVCVESFREVEANNGGTLSPTATLSPTLRDRSFSFKNTTSV